MQLLSREPDRGRLSGAQKNGISDWIVRSTSRNEGLGGSVVPLENPEMLPNIMSMIQDFVDHDT